MGIRELNPRLGANFAGHTIQGSGLDMEILRRVKAETFEIVFALTGGDNRNLMLAQGGFLEGPDPALAH